MTVPTVVATAHDEGAQSAERRRQVLDETSGNPDHLNLAVPFPGQNPVFDAGAALEHLAGVWANAGFGPDGPFVDVSGDRGVPTFPLYLRDMLLLHVKRNKAYVGTIGDPLANYIRAGATVGIPGWKAALIRMGEKMHRLSNVAIHPENVDEEQIEDTALDIAVIALLFLDLHRQQR